MSSASQNEAIRGERNSNRISVGHVIVVFMGAVAVGNALSLRKRLLHIERFHEAARQAGKQKERLKSAHEEYVRSRLRRERLKQAELEAEEEMRRQTRYQHMKEDEDRLRDRYRRAYARWQRESEQHQQQEQQHQYWDGHSFGHGWSEETERRRSSQWQRQRHGGETVDHGMGAHLELLGLDRQRPLPFSQDEIKAAFREKALECHPDRNPHDSGAAQKKFQKVLNAYHALNK